LTLRYVNSDATQLVQAFFAAAVPERARRAESAARARARCRLTCIMVGAAPRRRLSDVTAHRVDRRLRQGDAMGLRSKAARRP